MLHNDPYESAAHVELQLRNQVPDYAGSEFQVVVPRRTRICTVDAEHLFELQQPGAANCLKEVLNVAK